MDITVKAIYVSSDGKEHETEQAARDRELEIELQPMIQSFLKDRGITQTSRVRGSTVEGLMGGFAVHLLSPPSSSEPDPSEEPEK